MTWPQVRGRPRNMPEDRSPLRSQAVDVDARVCWLMRVTRMASPLGGTGEEFSQRLATLGIHLDGPAISRLESNQRTFPAALISAYETLLERPGGSLLAVCDAMCRTLSYRSIRPARELPDSEVREELDRISEVIRHGQPTGGDWLSLAHLMTQSNGIVLPRFVEDQWLYQLIDEMSRAAGSSYITRIEAMSRVMTHAFGAGRLMGVGLDRIREAGVQGAGDVVHVWGDGHDRASVEQAIALLAEGEDLEVQRGAALALLQRVIEGRLETTQVARLVEATRAMARDDRTMSQETAFMLGRRISPEFGAEISATTGCLPGSAPGGARIDRPPPELRTYVEAAREHSGIEEDRMFERMLREALTDDFPERRFQSRMMLGASPYAPVIADTALHVQRSSQSRAARQAAALLLTHLSLHVTAADLEPMLDSSDPYIRGRSLVALAHGPGIRHDLDLHTHLLDPEVGLKAAYAAGMTRHPDLGAGSTHRLASPVVRRTAQWWTHRGGRVDDLTRDQE